MSTTTLHIAVAQICAKAVSPGANLARIERQVHAASIQECEVILFAETACHAYVMTRENLALAEPAGEGPCTRQLIQLATSHHIAILAGFLEATGDGICNSHFCVKPDGSWSVARKTVLTPPELAAGLIAGDGKFAPFVIKNIPTAIVICADGGHPDLEQRMRDHGQRFRFCPTAGGDVLFGTQQTPMSESDLQTEAGRLRYAHLRTTVFDARPLAERTGNPLCGFASANALGNDGAGTNHLGHCMIVDNDLVLRAQIPGTPVAEHKLDQMTHAHVRF